MIGDKLAAGAPSASFTFHSSKKYDEAEMQRDLHRLPQVAFMEKYMIASPEYAMLQASDGEQTSILIRQIQEHTEAIERLTELEKREDEGLLRECFIDPFAGFGVSGRLIVSRDQPVLRKEISNIAIPRHLRKEKERLPTTGHVVKARVMNNSGQDVSADYLGMRVLFGPMSGTVVCFKGYPTWLVLDVAEILGIVQREDAEIVEEELEPL